MKFDTLTRSVFGAGAAAVLLVLITHATAAQNYFPTNTAVLRWLDKVTGRVNTIRTPVGEPLKIGTLIIQVDTCMTRPPEETPESAAFLKIWDEAGTPDRELVFSGWMFASSPSVSALDHAVYDVWVLDCEAATNSISSE
jgi:hypothetical protein